MFNFSIRYTTWMPCLPMVSTNTNYIIGPTKEKIRESYRDFREKRNGAHGIDRVFHVFRSSSIRIGHARYIAHSRKIVRTSIVLPVDRLCPLKHRLDRKIFFRNKYGMIMEWSKRLERMIDRTLFPFFFFSFFLRLWSTRAEEFVGGKKKKQW